MFQQPDLGFHPPRGRESAQCFRAKDAVAWDQNRDRVCAAGLPDRLRRGPEGARKIAVGARFAQGNRNHRPAHLSVQPGAMVQRQIEPRQAAVEIGLKLGDSLGQQGCGVVWGAVPRQGGDLPALLGLRGVQFLCRGQGNGGLYL